MVRGVALFQDEFLLLLLLFGTCPNVFNTEVPSFQGVGIEDSIVYRGCPHFRGLE